MPDQGDPPDPPEVPAGLDAGPEVAGGSVSLPIVDPEEERRRKQELVAQENAILEKVSIIRAAQAAAVAIKQPPSKEPKRTLAHWDYLLRECRWLAEDVAQERLWKMEVARKLAHEIASLDRKQLHAEMLSRKSKDSVPPAEGKRTRGAKTKREGPQENGDHSMWSEGVDKRSIWETSGVQETPEMAPSTPPVNDAILTYQMIDGAVERYFEIVELESHQRMKAHDLAVRDYEVEMERVRRLSREAAKRREEEARLAAMEAAAAEAEARRIALAREEAGKARKKKKSDVMEGVSTADLLGKRQGSSIQDGIVKKQRYGEAEGIAGPDGLRGMLPTQVGEYLVEYVERRGKKGMIIKDKNGTVLKGAELKKAQVEVAKRQKIMEKQQRDRDRLPGDAVPWTKPEDHLLCAIVLEFGSNWALVADILNVHSHFQGWHRKADSCRARFRLLTSAEDGTPNEESMFASMNLNRGNARLLVQRSIPAEDAVLRNHVDKIGKFFKAFTAREAQEKQSRKGENSQLVSVHASHTKMETLVSASVPSGVLTPQALADIAIAATNANLQQVGLQSHGTNGGADVGGTQPIQGMRQHVQQVQGQSQPLHGQASTYPGMPGFNAGLTPAVGMGSAAARVASGQGNAAMPHGKGLPGMGQTMHPGMNANVRPGASAKLGYAQESGLQSLAQYPGGASEQQPRQPLAASHDHQQGRMYQQTAKDKKNPAWGSNLLARNSAGGAPVKKEEITTLKAQELSASLASKANPKIGSHQENIGGMRPGMATVAKGKPKPSSPLPSKNQGKKPPAKPAKSPKK